jgi:hypothetical protein
MKPVAKAKRAFKCEKKCICKVKDLLSNRKAYLRREKIVKEVEIKPILEENNYPCLLI